jgi:hypothetical protein
MRGTNSRQPEATMPTNSREPVPSAPTTYPPVLARDPFSAQLTRSGKWTGWARRNPDVAWPATLDDAVRAWRREKNERSYQLLARLTWLGSRRGGNDNDAALAVLALLDPGIRGLAAKLNDLCGVDDVRAAVWEEVRNAEPQLGRLVARYLLKRAKQRLLRPAAGLAPRDDGTVSLDALLGERGNLSANLIDATAGSQVTAGEEPRRELGDLLAWAEAARVLTRQDAALLAEFVDLNHLLPDDQARAHLGSRHGLAPSTIRRRRAAAVKRLRHAVPDYLAATA